MTAQQLMDRGWVKFQGEFENEWHAVSEDGSLIVYGYRSGWLYCVGLAHTDTRRPNPIRTHVTTAEHIFGDITSLLDLANRILPPLKKDVYAPGTAWRHYSGEVRTIQAVVSEESESGTLVVTTDAQGNTHVCQWSEFEAFVSYGSYRGPRCWLIDKQLETKEFSSPDLTARQTIPEFDVSADRDSATPKIDLFDLCFDPVERS